MAPTIGRVALDNGFHGSIPGDWVAPPPQNIHLILGTTRRKYPTKVRQLAAIQKQERAAMRLQEALITTGGKEL